MHGDICVVLQCFMISQNDKGANICEMRISLKIGFRQRTGVRWSSEKAIWRGSENSSPAHISSSKYKLFADKGSVFDCNMTRSIFASLALQLFLISRQVHTSLPQLLQPSWPRDRDKHLVFCFWILKPIFSSIRRPHSHSSSFWEEDKFTQPCLRYFNLVTQLTEG